MALLRFQCMNCGEQKKRDILNMKHAVLGCSYQLNRQAECCRRPNYRDREGFADKMKEASISLLPGIKT
ncbi:MAG: hypothetical protein ABEJ93_05005 [Candidatus Nanohalobium sp.]